jgi:hypothetical protein
MSGPHDYDGPMSSDDPAAVALQYLEQAMDAANTLIGELIRRIDDSGRLPRLRVVGGGREHEGPSGDGHPRLRVL